LDKAALTAIQNLDLKWNPGEKDGKIVKQKITLPVKFAL
jgi:hypothetical protein